jgi:hypothetical protein
METGKSLKHSGAESTEEEEISQISDLCPPSPDTRYPSPDTRYPTSDFRPPTSALSVPLCFRLFVSLSLRASGFALLLYLLRSTL